MGACPMFALIGVMRALNRNVERVCPHAVAAPMRASGVWLPIYPAAAPAHPRPDPAGIRLPHSPAALYNWARAKGQ
jgi:hypothetical protein